MRFGTQIHSRSTANGFWFRGFVFTVNGHDRSPRHSTNNWNTFLLSSGRFLSAVGRQRYDITSVITLRSAIVVAAAAAAARRSMRQKVTYSRRRLIMK